MTHSFCTKVATIKRNTDLGSGRTGAAATVISALPITPVWPVNANTVESLQLSSPREQKECYHVPTGDTLPDVRERDTLTTGGMTYIVVAVAEWPDITRGIPCLQIIVEEVKGT